MSSSPIVGQTQINVDLEKALCTFFKAQASILFVCVWASNVTTIDALVSKGDLILCAEPRLLCQWPAPQWRHHPAVPA
jgi:7-keto-8-aminopelargonate synthetase-like enzyme